MATIDTRLIAILQESNLLISKRIKRAMYADVTKTFAKAQSVIYNALKIEVAKWISDSPELESILSGSLKGDFGIVAPAGPVNAIIQSVAGSVDVEFHALTRNLTGTALSIQVQPKSLANVLGIIPPVVTEKGDSLPWIEWLLKRGDDIIISDYHVVEGDHGRTGMAVMKAGGSYKVSRVNPSFSGTEDDNFITRALADKGMEIANVLAKSLEKVK
tara:strand:+ start:589 stop:1236 length:648 start_codon:yes stop_codon:yes gene_type:complete